LVFKEIHSMRICSQENSGLKEKNRGKMMIGQKDRSGIRF